MRDTGSPVSIRRRISAGVSCRHRADMMVGPIQRGGTCDRHCHFHSELRRGAGERRRGRNFLRVFDFHHGGAGEAAGAAGHRRDAVDQCGRHQCEILRGVFGTAALVSRSALRVPEPATDGAGLLLAGAVLYLVGCMATMGGTCCSTTRWRGRHRRPRARRCGRAISS